MRYLIQIIPVFLIVFCSCEHVKNLNYYTINVETYGVKPDNILLTPDGEVCSKVLYKNDTLFIDNKNDTTKLVAVFYYEKENNVVDLFINPIFTDEFSDSTILVRSLLNDELLFSLNKNGVELLDQQMEVTRIDTNFFQYIKKTKYKDSIFIEKYLIRSFSVDNIKYKKSEFGCE